MRDYEVVVFYMELIVFIDGVPKSIVAVSSDSDECAVRAYEKFEELESLGHDVRTEEVRYGIL